MPVETSTHVSAEQDGRVLSGAADSGATSEALQEVMDRHAPEPETAPATEATPATPTATEPVKESRGRQRFTDLTREREEARAEAATAKAEREAIARERDELKARLSQPQQPPREPERPVAPVYTRPEPDVNEVGTKYETYEQFTRDQALWVHEQQAQSFDGRIQQALERDRYQRTFNDTIEKTRAKGRETYADFNVHALNGPGAQVPMSGDRLEAIIHHPQSEHLQYAIGKDAALAQRLATVGPIEFGIELAKLVPASNGTSHTAPTFTAPAPMQPVGTGSRTTVTPATELAGKGFDFDKSGYRQRRAQERGVKGRYT